MKKQHPRGRSHHGRLRDVMLPTKLARWVRKGSTHATRLMAVKSLALGFAGAGTSFDAA